MLKHVESRLYASVIGTGAGGIVSAFLLWLLGVTVWGAPSNAESASDALAAVPVPVVGVIGLIVTCAGTAILGYSADPTPRPDLSPVVMVPVGQADGLDPMAGEYPPDAPAGMHEEPPYAD